MKRLLLFARLIVLDVCATAQISDSAILRNYINTNIVPNSTRSITATQLNYSLTGLLNVIQRYKVDTIFTNGARDTLFFIESGVKHQIKLSRYQSDIVGLVDSLNNRLTIAQSDLRYKSVGYIPTWSEITSKPTTLAGYGITSADALLTAKVNVSDTAAMLSPYMRKPYGTDTTLNAILVLDGQNNPWVRPVSTLPFVMNQLAFAQTADMWNNGTTRHVGVLQKVAAAGATSNLIDFTRSDLTTIARMGYWNSGVVGANDSYATINFQGPNWLVGKKDSTIALGTVDGTTVSAKLVIKGRNILLYKKGIKVSASGMLLDSVTAAPIPLQPYFVVLDCGGDTVAMRVTGRIIGIDAVNANELATKGQNDNTYQPLVNKTRTVTASATIAITDQITFVNNPAAACTLTLPAASGNTGRILEFAVNNTSVQTVTIGPYSTTATSGGCRLTSDGTNWRIISKF